jgi:hypothetical protein
MPDLAEKRPKTVSFYDVKDPTHPYYKHSQKQQAKHHDDWAVRENLFGGPSKDTANLEAVEDPELVPSTASDIPSHATSEAMPLDATAREDTMREDAPLATSHDTSLSPTSADAMPGGLTDSCALQRTRTYDSREYPDDYPFHL